MATYAPMDFSAWILDDPTPGAGSESTDHSQPAEPLQSHSQSLTTLISSVDPVLLQDSACLRPMNYLCAPAPTTYDGYCTMNTGTYPFISIPLLAFLPSMDNRDDAFLGISPFETLLSGRFSPPESVASPFNSSVMSQDGVESDRSEHEDDFGQPIVPLSLRRMARTRASRGIPVPRSPTEIASTSPKPRSPSSRTGKRSSTSSEAEDACCDDPSCFGGEGDDNGSEYQGESSVSGDPDDEEYIDRPMTSPSRRSTISKPFPAPARASPLQTIGKAPPRKPTTKLNGSATKKKKANSVETDRKWPRVCAAIVTSTGKGGQYTKKGVAPPRMWQVCKMVCSSESEFTRHWASGWHKAAMYTCDKCGHRLANRRDNINRHLKNSCKGVLKYKEAPKRPAKKTSRK